MVKKIWNMLTVMFFIICTLFTISVVEPTTNYVRFYQALQSLEILITDLSSQTTNTTIVKVTTNFKIINPSAYRGLALRSLQVINTLVTFEDTDDTINLFSGTQVWYKDLPINPYSNRTLTIDFDIKGQPATQFLEILNNYTGSVIWRLTGQFLVYTFIKTIRISFDISHQQISA